MRLFKLNPQLSIVCEASSTRTGFKHTATLLKNSGELDSTKCTYQNRTWESYEYQSVIKQLISGTGALTDREKKRYLKKF